MFGDYEEGDITFRSVVDISLSALRGPLSDLPPYSQTHVQVRQRIRQFVPSLSFTSNSPLAR